jgi:hypothetical protein
VPSQLDGHITTEQLVNLLRNRGYRFRGERKSTKLWSHPQTTHAVNVPLAKRVAIAEARIIFRQMGMKPEEIEDFLGAACA